MICFHAMWGPWARIVAKKIEEGSGLKIADKVYEVFGYCNQKNIVEPGVLAEGTSAMVKQRLQNLLVSEGINKERAVQIVKDSYVEADHTSKESLRPLDDLHTLFRVLKEHDMKIAICTSDSRYGTLQSLESLGLLSQIDRLVCGDDIDNIPKPAQYNANMICSELNVDPSEAIMVGDSLADVGMGRLANLGGSIGVSTGVTPREELEPHADVVVDRLMDIVPLILPAEVHKNYSLVAEDGQVRYPPQTGADQRGAVKPRRSVAIRPGKKASLVIFDKDGSLVYFNSYWPEWIKKLKQR
ncbi:uncharacterized protein LOC106170926 [Lingula anatina]|uniref:Uncharacterized protein LOC106170926 n=1 Tax=Lingula anatina TaxID=7574 RepID=A0A2R2MK06_LINAN|nr:uncharacterized protein LOC106170926 [Lingula anatina]|eukprot:XP_023930538.1 uncharacterized protein LOC106170926 [Lingula anatina]